MYAHKHGLIGKFFTELIFGAKKIIRDVASGCCHERSRVGENFVQSLHAGEVLLVIGWQSDLVSLRNDLLGSV
jgi:hypothetical protein